MFSTRPFKPTHARGSSSSSIPKTNSSRQGGIFSTSATATATATPSPTPLGTVSGNGSTSGASVFKADRRPAGLRTRSTAPYLRSTTAAPPFNTVDGQRASGINTDARAAASAGLKRGITANGKVGGVGAKSPIQSIALNAAPSFSTSQLGQTKARSAVKEPPHMPLHRRLLFPTLPLDQDLPPIVLGAGPGVKAVNERLYHLIALLLRAYILSWYPSITKDRSLLPHLSSSIIVPLLSPLLTGIYEHPERIVDLVLLDLPRVLEMHVKVYWQARAAVERSGELGTFDGASQRGGLGFQESGTGDEWVMLDSEGTLPEDEHKTATATNGHKRSDGPTGVADKFEIALGKAYHLRLPLPAIHMEPSHLLCSTADTANHTPGPTTPEELYRAPIQPHQQVISPMYLTALAESILKLHLPPAAFGCDVERVMMRELLGRVVLGSVVRRLGEGWFWLQMGLKVLGPPGANSQDKVDKGCQVGGVASTTGHIGTDRALGYTAAGARETILFWVHTFWRVILLIWSGMSWAIASSVTLLASMSSDVESERDRERYTGLCALWLALFRAILGVDGREGLYLAPWALRLTWGAVEAVVTLFSPFIDRAIPHVLHTRLTPTLSMSLIDCLESVLLPDNGYPGPAEPDPKPDEVRAMRAQLVQRMSEIIPSWLLSAPALAQSNDGSIATIQRDFFQVTHGDSGYQAFSDDPAQRLIEPFSSPGCNAHLMALMLDIVVGAVEPAFIAEPHRSYDADNGDKSKRPGSHKEQSNGSQHFASEVRGNDDVGVRWRTARGPGALIDAMGAE